MENLDEDGICVHLLEDETCCDARKLIVDRFPSAALIQLDKVRTNPLLREYPACGFIAYENGTAACFQALIPRAFF